MSKIYDKILYLFSSIPGRMYLLIAIIIFSASNSVTRKLTVLGMQKLIDGRNPISFCNVLFVGNICALVLLFFFYRKQWNIQSFKQLSRADWLGLIGVAILSGALAPSLIFMALESTLVNNVVLIGRIEPPLILTLSIFLLRERVNRWVIAGAAISFFGVFLTVFLQDSGENMVDMGGVIQVGKGELMAAGGAIALAISNIISKVKLRQISLGFFTIFRTATGTVIFFVIVINLYGASHFTDVFSLFLWQWMLIYGAVIVVGGQLCWFMGLKTTGASEVSLASSFSPIVGILTAYFILGEAPNMAQYIGGSVIICGIVLNQIGVYAMNAEKTTPPRVSPAKEMDIEVGFKGI